MKHLTNVLLRIQFTLMLNILLCNQAHSQMSLDTNSRPPNVKATNGWFAERGAEGCVQTSISARPQAGSYDIIVVGHTNIIAFRPLPSQAFDATLFYINGKQLSKTSTGREFGTPLKVDDELLDPAHHVIMNYLRDERTLYFNYGDSELIGRLNILKSFRIREPGEYRLQVEVRLFTKDTNGVFQPFILPPVETKVKISESDLK